MAIPRVRLAAPPTRISKSTAPRPRPVQPTAPRPKLVQSIPPITRAKPSSNLSLRFVQNVALLQILSDFRSPVVDNSTSKETVHEDGTLVHTLAFLSAADADSSHITAVAVEDVPATANPEAPLLRVHVAINKSSPTSNDTELIKIVKGIQDLFAILAQHKNSIQQRNELLNRIVCLCHAKLLSRLGHSGDKKRSSLGAQIEKVVGIVKAVNFQRIPSPEKLFLDCSAPVVQALQCLSQKNPLPDDLAHIIHAVYRFRKTLGKGMDDVIDQWTSGDMNSAERESLIRRIDEVARYKRCANFLCRLAQSSKTPPWLGRVEVVAVQPKEDDFTSTFQGNTADVSLGRYLTQRSAMRLADVLKPFRGLRYDIASIFKNTCWDWIRHGKAKIHAEIQIAHSLERSRRGRPAGPSSKPVICASKHACYLCHAFFVAHPGLAEPPTHGTLYPGWRLPADWQAGRSAHASNDARDCLRHFNEFMERDIDKILARLSKPGARPNRNTSAFESPLFEMEASNLSLASTLASGDTMLQPSSRPGPRSLLLTPPTSPLVLPTQQIEKLPPPPPLTPPRSPLVLPRNDVRSHPEVSRLGKRRRESKEQEALGGLLPGAYIDTLPPSARDTSVCDGTRMCKTIFKKAPVEEASADKVPAKRVSIRRASMERMPLKRTSVDRASVKKVQKRTVLDMLESVSAKGNSWR